MHATWVRCDLPVSVVSVKCFNKINYDCSSSLSVLSLEKLLLVTLTSCLLRNMSLKFFQGYMVLL